MQTGLNGTFGVEKNGVSEAQGVSVKTAFTERGSPPEVSLNPPKKIRCTIGEAIVDALLRGSNVQQIANKLTNGSILKVLKILSDEVSVDEIDAICKVSEAVRQLQLEQIKSRAMQELSEIAQGCFLDDGGLTSDEARAVEIQRRTCVSILRLNAKPTRRDSYQDERGASFMSSGGRFKHGEHGGHGGGLFGSDKNGRFNLFGSSALRAEDCGTKRAAHVSKPVGDYGNEKTQKRKNEKIEDVKREDEVQGKDNEPVARASCPGKETNHTRRLEACATGNKPAHRLEACATGNMAAVHGSENRGTGVNCLGDGGVEVCADHPP